MKWYEFSVRMLARDDGHARAMASLMQGSLPSGTVVQGARLWPKAQMWAHIPARRTPEAPETTPESIPEKKAE